MFFAAANSTGRGTEFFGPIKRLFLGLGQERFADLAIGPLFGEMLDAKVDPTETAFAFLDAGIFVDMSLNVLGDSVNAPADLERLGQLQLAYQFDEPKSRAMKRIRLRVASATTR